MLCGFHINGCGFARMTKMNSMLGSRYLTSPITEDDRSQENRLEEGINSLSSIVPYSLRNTRFVFNNRVFYSRGWDGESVNSYSISADAFLLACAQNGKSLCSYEPLQVGPNLDDKGCRPHIKEDKVEERKCQISTHRCSVNFNSLHFLFKHVRC